MGKSEAFIRNDDMVIVQKIDVDCTWTPADGTFSSHLPLDAKAKIQKRMWGKGGFDMQALIEKGRLFDNAKGGRAVKA